MSKDDDWLSVGDYSLDRIISPEQEAHEEMAEQNAKMKEDMNGLGWIALLVLAIWFF